ncbi:MAG TPA: formylglycine-generating enzyme family protein [Opitutae bacterium]|nr:formylglycine-generating enzyme family protein [Opitutae bacterium]
MLSKLRASLSVVLLLHGSVSADPAVSDVVASKGASTTLVDLGGGETLKLKWIAADVFEMGSPTWESGRGSDERRHLVTLTEGYWLGETEVTQAQWQAVMGSNPSYFKGSSLPVDKVNWHDAMKFCRKLTESERAASRLPEGMVYTLPTEAQWEYACRAGVMGAYAGSLKDMGWYSANSDGKTHAVGQKLANAWGFYDMHGNVFEWVNDWVASYGTIPVTDPLGPDSGSYRAARGGSWSNSASYCRSALRARATPGSSGDILGFRVSLRSLK